MRGEAGEHALDLDHRGRQLLVGLSGQDAPIPRKKQIILKFVDRSQRVEADQRKSELRPRPDPSAMFDGTEIAAP